MDSYNYFPSLDVSKRLKELGAPQNTPVTWHYRANDSWLDDNEDLSNDPELGIEQCSAFTTDDLGVLLPKFLERNNTEVLLRCYWNQAGDYCYVSYYGDAYVIPDVVDRHEAEARAKMLVYLLENNLFNF